MNNLPLKIQKYLNKYSIPGWSVEINTNNKFNNIVVIPAIYEYENIKRLLTLLLSINTKYLSFTLFLFVINNKKMTTDNIKEENKHSLELLEKIVYKNKGRNDTLVSFLIDSIINIGFIDASTEGKELPNKTAGVGLARKIGMDYSLNLFDFRSTSKKILICLDADCRVSKNYLTEIVESFNKKNINTAVIRYEHNINKNDDETKAIICYEIFLRHYHLGLLYANSTYAFPAIGSAMACDVESYILVEGMNKRKAAEDFYFLEKLAKSYKIHEINNAVVYPSERKSWRVPFGTGQRVGRFLSNEKNEYVLFDPLSFDILKKWLFLFLNDKENNVENIISQAKNISPHLYYYLNAQKFINIMNGIIKNSKSERQLYNQKLKWFDGFKTLKLIHYLRDAAYPEINMFDALDELFKILNINFKSKRKKGTIPSIDIQKKYLIEMRNYIYR